MANQPSLASPINTYSKRLVFLPESASFWESVPSYPGVYFFEDQNKNPLYIGKSINLKSRLKQHLEGFRDKSTKASLFVPQTKFYYFKVLENDIQTIITEANYIKFYTPKYNSITKDDKSNLYIVFSNFPDTRILLSRATDLQTFDVDNYQRQVFGPYTSASITRILLKHCRKTFGYCLHPQNAAQKACFNYHLGQCPGACTGKISADEYKHHLALIKKFLNGKFTLLLKNLKSKINLAIKKQEFEIAEKYKKQFESLNYILGSNNSNLLLKLSDSTPQTQIILVETLKHPKLTKTPQRIECYDLAHLQGSNYVGAMTVMVEGRLKNSEYRHFNVSSHSTSDPHAMKEIISRRLQHPEWPTPDLIILDGGVPQLNTVLPIVPETIPVIALAKKRETLIFYDKDNNLFNLNLSIEDPVLNQIITLRDEAHRFGNSFHKKQRSKSMLI